MVNAPEIVSLSDNVDEKFETLERIRRHLVAGKLVGIPTETVYGLAANGYNEEAVRNIFAVKGRPFNDPVILHVPTFAHALKSIFDVSVFEAYLILNLATRFSPGPLTIAARGKSSISMLISAGTGFPAARCPSHRDAQEILRFVDLPLAAPSANMFCHISPTCARDVVEEFPNVDVLVVDGGPCIVGLESTVVKIEPIEELEPRFDVVAQRFGNLSHFLSQDPQDVVNALELDVEFMKLVKAASKLPRTIKIMRRGRVLESDIKDALAGELFINVQVTCPTMFVHDEDKVCDAPGMLLKHYSPIVSTYLVARAGNALARLASVEAKENVVLIDIGGAFKSDADKFLHWIFIQHDDEMVAQQLYATLRKAEKIAVERKQLGHVAIIAIWYAPTSTALSATIADRLFRCAAGNYIIFN